MKPSGSTQRRRLTYLNRGFAWAGQGGVRQGHLRFQRGHRSRSKKRLGLPDRGIAFSEKKEYDKAIADLDESIRINPRDVDSHNIRGLAWIGKKEYDRAIDDFTSAVRIEPARPEAYDLRAWTWATCPEEHHRDGKKAVESATKACELTEWSDANYLETLAAACAEVGDFESAVKWQTKANALHADPEARKFGESRLELYQQKKPYRDAGP